MRKLAVLFLICCGFFLYYFFTKDEKLVFRTYKNLQNTNISLINIKTLAGLNEQCFAKNRRKNMIEYAIKSGSLSTHISRDLVAADVDRYLQKLKVNSVKNFKLRKNLTVMKKNNKIVGMYSCAKQDSFNDAFFIWNVCVAPEFRGKGNGRALVKHAIARCGKGLEHIYLTIEKEDMRAKKLYESFNFKTVPWFNSEDSLSEEFFNKTLMILRQEI
jgi:ribosomal protein S18 acetylase RimI-like enzyme